MLPHDQRFLQAHNAHYGHSEYGERIRQALIAGGADLEHLTVQDLAAIDHLHGGAKPATLQLAQLAGIKPGLKVADLGGGIGGPARTLAAEFGCTVDVVDLTEEFCRVGRWLTDLTRLDKQVAFHHASALATPLQTGAYDIVWMQNSGMNIEDRPGLYREVARLLKPNGRYAFQEVMQGPGGPALYPMNWASTAESSFLRTPAEVRRLVEEAGFKNLAWMDNTEEAPQSPAQLSNPGGTIPRPTYIPDQLGKQIQENGTRNRDEHRTVYYLGVFERA